MLPFVAGAAAVYLLALAVALIWSDGLIQPSAIPFLAFSVFFLPTLIAFATAEAAHAWHARRLFDPRISRPNTAVILGALSALLAVAMIAMAAAAVSAYLNQHWQGLLSDAVIAGASAALCTAAIIAPLPRRRPDQCIHCAYDLRGITTPRCPECGAFHSG